MSKESITNKRQSATFTETSYIAFIKDSYHVLLMPVSKIESVMPYQLLTNLGTPAENTLQVNQVHE